MNMELRPVARLVSDTDAIEFFDRRRYRVLAEAEKQRIIRQDMAAWVDTTEYLTKTQKKALLWDLSMGRCHYCQKDMNPFSDFSVDHVTPRSKGGNDDLSNLVACCRDCNRRKGNRDCDAWRRIE